MTLEPLKGVHEQESEEAERQEGRGVLCPPLFLLLANAAQFVDQHLDRPEDRMEERALALEQPRHEQPDRLRDEQDQAEEHENLENANASHRRPQNLSG